MEAAAVRARVRAEVRGRRRDRQALVGERVLDREARAERVAGLRVEHVLEHDPALLALADPPAGPADEAVDRVARLELVERQLLLLPVELVGAVLDPVRPRDQHLPAAGGDLPVGGVGVEQLTAARGVRPQAAAHLDDDGALVAVGDLELLAGRREHVYPGTGRTEGAGRRRATTNDQSPIAAAMSAANA